MRKFDFQLETEDDLILVEAWVNGYPLILALDTAASQTVVDWNALFLAGCSLPKTNSSLEKTLVETASGIIQVSQYYIGDFQALNLQKLNFPILTYDFLEKGLVSAHDGVLGIDFFRKNHILTIDFREEKLWLTS